MVDGSELPNRDAGADRVSWKAIAAEPDVQKAMHKHWPEHLAQDFDVKTFYEFLHMDRLTGRLAGRAEPLDGYEPGGVDAASYSV